MKPVRDIVGWLALVLGPLALMAVALIHWVVEGAREFAQEDAQSMARSVARVIDATGGVAYERLRRMGADPVIAGAVATGDVDALSRTVDVYRLHRDVVGLLVFDREGALVTSGGRVLQEDVDRVLERGVLVPVRGPFGLRVYLSAPVVRRGEVVGRLVMVVALDEVENVVDAFEDRAVTVYLLDEDGIAIEGPPDSRGVRISFPEEGTAFIEDQPVRHPFATTRALEGTIRVLAVRRTPATGSFVLLTLAGVLAVAILLGLGILSWTRRVERAEAGVGRRERELRAMQEMAVDATVLGDTERVLRVASARAAELIGVTSAAVVLVDSDRRAELRRTYPLPEAPVTLDVTGNSLLFRAINHGRRECGLASAHAREWIELGFGEGRWECWTPLVAHRKVLGALGLFCDDPRPPIDIEEGALLDGLAANLAGALESQSRLAELEHQRAMLSTVVEASPDGLAALDDASRIVLDNPAFRGMLKLDRTLEGEPISRALSEFRGRGGRIDLDFDYQRTLEEAKEGRTTRGALRLIYGGQVRSMESLMVSLRLPTGGEGVLLSLRDVSERAELDQVRSLHKRVAVLAEQASSRAALLDKVLAASELGLVFLDREGRVAYSNELFGSLVGIPSPSRGMPAMALEEAVASRAAGYPEGLVFRGGEMRIEGPPSRLLSVRAVEVGGEDGQPLGRLISLRDDTRRRELEEAREAFLAVAAHEMRNPVTALRMMAEMALRGDESQRTSMIQRIEARTRELQALVERLLDLTRADLGSFVLERRRVPLLPLVREVVDSHSVQGAELEVEGDPEACAWADPTRARQVVGNLVSNAIRYGEKRPVRVRVGRCNDETFVAVSDEGRGIPEIEREKIFSRFGRGQSGSRGPGLGIGLYISRRIAEAHGGRIELDSVPGEGSTFTLVLPRAWDEPSSDRTFSATGA